MGELIVVCILANDKKSVLKLVSQAISFHGEHAHNLTFSFVGFDYLIANILLSDGYFWQLYLPLRVYSFHRACSIQGCI